MRCFGRERGVDPQRLIFTPHVDHAEHLARHLHMDLFLDTLQFNAVTTACHAIYTGVPILTLAGGHVLSRACNSFMQAAGPAAITQQFIGYTC